MDDLFGNSKSEVKNIKVEKVDIKKFVDNINKEITTDSNKLINIIENNNKSDDSLLKSVKEIYTYRIAQMYNTLDCLNIENILINKISELKVTLDIKIIIDIIHAYIKMYKDFQDIYLKISITDPEIIKELIQNNFSIDNYNKILDIINKNERTD